MLLDNGFLHSFTNSYYYVFVDDNARTTVIDLFVFRGRRGRDRMVIGFTTT